MLITPRPGLLYPRGALIYTLRRDGRVLTSGRTRNTVVNEGKNDFLNKIFNGGTTQGMASLDWWLGIVDNSGFGAFDVTDTLVTHSGWTEFTDYTPVLPSLYSGQESTSRGYWWRNGASSGEVLGADATGSITFTFSNGTTKMLQGIFVTTDQTRDGTSGIIWATAPFVSPVTVNSGDTMNLHYNVSL
jgi:hypothetical protein